ncbi:Xaa-Pro dipeptidase [Kangiella sp. HZ709]|uniref:Xaa-Pro dipeptidase n=1 Tax=Kangiella sp. HZ709 TaxID=2666328 RepID=UPI0012B08514|nr:Xaa-Pro dipeptidase [Kangiella sp. HZ709]MRX27970.1 Xaa-Pro dipeptidase [Kangiella sp. HZ709]
MQTLFSNHIEVITDRYFQAMQKHGFDHLLIPAGSLLEVFLDDNKYPFKANFHFLSFVPLPNIHDSCLILTPGKKPVLCFYQPIDFWHLVAGDPEGYWVEHFDIKMMRQKDEVRGYMPSNGNIAFIGEMVAPYQDDDFDAINPMGLIHEINWHRARKTSYEIECSSRANQMAAAGHLAAKEMFYNNGSELEIHLAYQLAVGQNESELPYSSIVGLNEHASILHYVNYEAKSPSEHRSFLIDAGARYNGYAADITRTYAKEDNEFAELIQDVNTAQMALNEKVKPGDSYIDLHARYHFDVAKLLAKYGLSSMSPESMVEAGVTSTFFPHGLGHQIGLQVHDVGGHQANIEGDTAPPPAEYPFLRNTRTMEAGQILTIEPGLYFIDSLLGDLKNSEHAASMNWSKIESFMPFGGIRIEDDILVTASGHRNLTREFLPE